MATIWYVDASGNRAGPVEVTQAIGLIKTGMIGPTTLVWAEGMADWAAASQAPLLAGQFIATPPSFPPPPGFPPTSAAVSTGTASAGGALSTDATVVGLLWRLIFYVVGLILVIPAPWAGTTWLGYAGETTRLPDGSNLRFSGRVGEIWWAFVLLALAEVAPQFLRHNPYFPLLALLITIPLSVWVNWTILRWFVGNLHTRAGALSFSGGFWGYLGYSLLLIVSIYTIIGWAWVFKLLLAWACRNVQGPVRFEFRGSGLSILWRSLVAGLASCLVIPIPWMIAWQYRWFVSQIQAEPR